MIVLETANKKHACVHNMACFDHVLGYNILLLRNTCIHSIMQLHSRLCVQIIGKGSRKRGTDVIDSEDAHVKVYIKIVHLALMCM